MKKKDLQSLRAKNAGELSKLVGKKRLELNGLYPEIKAGQKKSAKNIRGLKLDIAQTLTLIRERELIEQSTKNNEYKNEKNAKK